MSTERRDLCRRPIGPRRGPRGHRGRVRPAVPPWVPPPDPGATQGHTPRTLLTTEHIAIFRPADSLWSHFCPRRTTLGRRFTEGLIGMTGEALFFFPLFRGVLRLVGDRVVLERARCSEHEVVRELQIDPAERRVRGSEPGRALGAGFNSAWL